MALLLQWGVMAFSGQQQADQVAFGIFLCALLAAVGVVKLLAEAAIFCWLRTRTFTSLRRTALLMSGELAVVTSCRFILGAIGCVIIPLCLMSFFWHDQQPIHPWKSIAIILLMFALSLSGEIVERYLFFVAVVAPKMPGGPVT